MAGSEVAAPKAESQRRYLRPPAPLFFPTSESVPETRRHLEVRTALFQMLQAAFGDRAVLGSEQFVYWDPSNPRACCAPDVMLRFGERDAPFDSWKIWDRGAPHLAIEVISASDATDRPWAAKLERYRHVGLRELVRFDPEDPLTPIRIWDQMEGDLVERDPVAASFARSDVLGAFWVVVPHPELGLVLRLAHDEGGTDLYLTPIEQAAAERERAAVEREQAAVEREQAAAHVARLEAELAALRKV